MANRDASGRQPAVSACRTPAVALLCTLSLAPSACGVTSSARDPAAGRVSEPSAPARAGQLAYGTDRDNDNDHNDDDQRVLQFGRTATAAERSSITAPLGRYYAAAAAANGRGACSLLIPFVAESIPEQYGTIASLRGHDCGTVMRKLFRKHHAQLAAKQPVLKVVRIGVEGDHALVVIDFPEIPEVRQMTMRRSHGRWYVLTLLDGIIE